MAGTLRLHRPKGTGEFASKKRGHAASCNETDITGSIFPNLLVFTFPKKCGGRHFHAWMTFADLNRQTIKISFT
jgi:hypothetical protein